MQPISNFQGNHEHLICLLYLSETMIYAQFAEFDAHAFPRAHQLCAFETVGVQKIQPFLLDLENSARITVNKNYVYVRKHRKHS